MSIRPRTLVFLTVVACAFVGLTGCSDGSPASVVGADDNPPTEGTDPAEDAACDSVVTVGGTTYHVVPGVGDDYGVQPDEQVEGTASDCSGEGSYPITLHAIPKVDPTWALCGRVEGQWRMFVADGLQVPADSRLARLIAVQ